MADVYQVAVGDELLCGRTVDTNSPWLQRELARLGLTVRRVTVVGDDADAVAAVLETVPAGALVVTTGGLGPTDDDLTAAAVARWADLPLEEDPAVREHLERRAAARGRPAGPHLVRQARRPRGFTPLINPAGTAPALVGRARDRWLLLLPGPPPEVRALWPSVADRLRELGLAAASLAVVRCRTAGLSEPALARRTEPLRQRYPDLAWSWWLSRWGVDVQVVIPAGGDPATAAVLARELADTCGPHLFTTDDGELPAVAVAALRARGWTAATAESCTGGMVAAALVDVPGASDVLRGGVVAYADGVKTALLDVPADLLAAHGAVSREVARAMAAGARARTGADVAVAVTGIAGPGGGTDAKPVGTTWLALASPRGTWELHRRFPAHRERNRQLAAAAALAGLWRHAAMGEPPWQGWEEF